MAQGTLTRARLAQYVPAGHSLGTGQDRESEVLAQMSAAMKTLPSQWWFSHTSAALAWGCWTWQLQPETHILRLSNPHIDQGDQSVVRHWTKHLPPDDRAMLAGVPVTSLERTVVDCARMLTEPQALVIADSALRLGADPRRMAEVVREASGKRGVKRARLVLELADGRSESPGETLVRWIAHFYGLPPLTPIVRVDTRGGAFEVDLAWPELKVAVEFDGEVKFSGGEYGDPEERRRAQQARAQMLRDAGWIVVSVTWDELLHGHLLALRLQKVLHEARVRNGR